MSALRKAADRFSETVIDDEIVVMQLDSGVFFSLRDSARRIWELLDGTRDHPALLAELTREFGGNPAEIIAEADTFLAQLGDAGLLEP